MKNRYKLAIAVLIILLFTGVIMIAMAIATETSSSSITNLFPNPPDKKYIIESIRYIGSDGNTTFDKWVINGKEMKITGQFIIFYPLDGEFAGKQHYIPFSNVHIIREI